MESLICRYCGASVLSELAEMPCQSCKADTLFRFVPADWPRTFRGVLRDLKWDNASVAEAFGYKNANSFAASSAAPVMREGLMRVYYATRKAGISTAAEIIENLQAENAKLRGVLEIARRYAVVEYGQSASCRIIASEIQQVFPSQPIISNPA